MLLPPLSLSIRPSSRICKRISKGAFQPGPNTPTGAGVAGPVTAVGAGKDERQRAGQRNVRLARQHLCTQHRVHRVAIIWTVLFLGHTEQATPVGAPISTPAEPCTISSPLRVMSPCRAAGFPAHSHSLIFIPLTIKKPSTKHHQHILTNILFFI